MAEKVIEKKKVRRELKGWGSIGKMDIAGYDLIKGKKGYRLDNLKDFEYLVVDRPYDIMYKHSYGLISKFFVGLQRKKLYGAKCPKCGDVFCPPRAHCWRNECKLEETKWIELPKEGILHSYTILGFSSEAFLPDLPFVLGYVRIKGANTLIAGRVLNIDPADVSCDMPVEIKFVPKPKGSPLDFYFAPQGKPKSKRTPKEAKRLREQLDVIRKWVRDKFGG